MAAIYQTTFNSLSSELCGLSVDQSGLNTNQLFGHWSLFFLLPTLELDLDHGSNNSILEGPTRSPGVSTT